MRDRVQTGAGDRGSLSRICIPRGAYRKCPPPGCPLERGQYRPGVLLRLQLCLAVFPRQSHPNLQAGWSEELSAYLGKGKLCLGGQQPSKVSKHFPLSKPFLLNLAKTFLPG